jgi:hypothetical protein
VQTVVDQLLSDCPFLTTPNGAFDQCVAASKTLEQDLLKAGIAPTRISVVGVQGYKPEARMLAEGLLPAIWKSLPQSTWSHFVTKVDSLYIDLTAKQFDPDHPCALVMFEDELQAMWQVVGTRII